MSSPPAKKRLLFVGYVVLQGLFLPLLLKLDDVSGVAYGLMFTLYEVLVVIDAMLGIRIFGKDK